LKHKKCCLGKKKRKQQSVREVYAQKYNIKLKEEADIKAMRRAGRLVLKTLDLVETQIEPGITTDSINTLVHEFTINNDAVPAPLNYRGFPKSVCLSVNEVICHGIPGERILQDGDIINVDVTSILNGYYADASKTFFVGTVSPEAERIVRVARESLKVGLDMVRPGNTVGDIGWAIQKYAEGEGCSVVEEFTGHGIGFSFHEPPQIPHFGRKGEGIRLVPGMAFTVEPMINVGKKDLRILDDKWTAVTLDGSLSAQFEQTVVVTNNGYESLTPFEL
jgi:methionyl aminopeptidase